MPNIFLSFFSLFDKKEVYLSSEVHLNGLCGLNITSQDSASARRPTS